MTIREHNLHAWVLAFRRQHLRWPTVPEAATGLRTRRDVVRLLARADARLRIDVVYPHGNPVDRTELVRRSYRSIVR